MDRWTEELAPGAPGWLGGTYGMTDEGEFVGVVRFESREAAAHNSTRPEQGEWWKQRQPCFDGDVTFHDCDDAIIMFDGGSDDAGFVQVIQGRVDDPATSASSCPSRWTCCTRRARTSSGAPSPSTRTAPSPRRWPSPASSGPGRASLKEMPADMRAGDREMGRCNTCGTSTCIIRGSPVPEPAGCDRGPGHDGSPPLPWWASVDLGGRERTRTSDPHRVKVVR